MAPQGRQGNQRKGVRELGGNVVMADFGARRRQEQKSTLRTPAVPKPKQNWAAVEFVQLVTETADSGRVSRGRDYFRSGRVLSVEVKDEQLVGWVKGTQPEPFYVCIQLPRIGEKDRKVVCEQLAAYPNNVKFLMMGDKPLPAVADRLMQRGSQVMCLCDCPDKAVVCKHTVAVVMHYAQQLDRDAVEILRLRGIDPQPFVEAVQGEAVAVPPQPGDSEVAELDVRRRQKEGNQRAVDPDKFWGRTSSGVRWVEPEVEEGHKLGDQKYLMDAVETFSWTCIDQLENRDLIERCYEELEGVEPLFDYSRRMSEVRGIKDSHTTNSSKEDE